jgi:ketosteroid isomerase-like protein
MLALILLSGTLLGPCDPASSPTLRVVCPYLEALAHLDHDAMAALWAPDVVIIDADGDVRPVQPAFAGDMRAYERAAGTRWGYTIDGVQGDSAFVTLTSRTSFTTCSASGRGHSARSS